MFSFDFPRHRRAEGPGVKPSMGREGKQPMNGEISNFSTRPAFCSAPNTETPDYYYAQSSEMGFPLIASLFLRVGLQLAFEADSLLIVAPSHGTKYIL